jgi:pyruvyltransferase
MKNTIWLYWFQKKDSTFGNYGDELSEFVISNLTESKVKGLPAPRGGIKLLASVFLGVLKSKNSMKDLVIALRFFCSRQPYVVAVGSIISWGGGGDRQVWGSGILAKSDPIPNANFLAVRGHYTIERLKECGYAAPDIVGDPAILMPLVLKPQVAKKYRIGIVAHHWHTHVIQQILPNTADFILISLLDELHEVTERICACDRIISTSLHGIIVAHTYGINAAWASIKSIPLAGDDIKFWDYFSSVEIPNYTPVEIDSNLLNMESIEVCFNSVPLNGAVGCDMNELRKGLLSVAPFPLKQEFRQFDPSTSIKV